MQHLLSHDKALAYILAGKSLFTVVNKITGNRFTFKVKKPNPKNDLIG